MEGKTEIPDIKGSSPPGEEVYIVVDEAGFVGAFYSKEDAQRVPKAYPMLSFAFFKSRLDTGKPRDTVYAIPYLGNNAIAFASNDLEKSRAVHKTLVRVSLGYEDDDVTYWKYPVGRLIEPVRTRLHILARGYQAYTTGALQRETAEELMKILTPGVDGPLAQALKETEKTTVLDCVELSSCFTPDVEIPTPSQQPSCPEAGRAATHPEEQNQHVA